MSIEKPSSPPASPTGSSAAVAAPSAAVAVVGSTSPVAAASPPAPAVPAPARPTSPPNQATDPVSALQAAFPSIDRAVIAEVLAAHGGNVDSASGSLLDMSSPSSDSAAVVAPGEHNRNAQMLSDEAYARELVAQMEREHQQEYGRPMNSPPGRQQHQQEVDYSQLNYAPRQRNRFGQPVGQPNQLGGAMQYGQQQQGEDGRWKHQDELDQLTEQFGKLADTGKKTFNSFLNKAKDKYVQVQQQRAYNLQNPGESSGRRGSGDGTGPTTIAGFTIPSIPAPWQGGLAGKQNHASNARPASPRDNLRTGALSPDNRESVMKDYSQSPSQSRPRYETRTSSDDDAAPIQINRSGYPTSQPSTVSRTGSSTVAPTLSSSPATAAPGFSTSPGIQHRGSFGSSPAKIQMLPRQTINLLDDANKEKDKSRSGSPAPAAGASGTADSSQKRRDDDDSDNESVEYVKNPFNDDD